MHCWCCRINKKKNISNIASNFKIFYKYVCMRGSGCICVSAAVQVFCSFATDIPDIPTARDPGGTDKWMITFPQNELHMRVRVSAALARAQNGSFSALTTYLDTLCSLSAVDQVWNHFLCLKWNHILVYTLLCCHYGTIPPAAAENRLHRSLKATSFTWEVSLQHVFTDWLHSFWCVYLRPVWLETMLGSLEELRAPSGSSSSL